MSTKHADPDEESRVLDLLVFITLFIIYAIVFFAFILLPAVVYGQAFSDMFSLDGLELFQIDISGDESKATEGSRYRGYGTRCGGYTVETGKPNIPGNSRAFTPSTGRNVVVVMSLLCGVVVAWVARGVGRPDFFIDKPGSVLFGSIFLACTSLPLIVEFLY